MLRPMERPLKPQQGFTLVEVLVAIVVLSIGLLGLAGLQATGLRNNHSAYLRTQATLQAYDIIDRMRANVLGQSAYYSTPTGKNCEGASANCSPADLADYDRSQWNAANANILPSGTGVVCRDTSPDDGTSTAPACDNAADAPVVKVWWIDERDGSVQRFVTSFRP